MAGSNRSPAQTNGPVPPNWAPPESETQRYAAAQIPGQGQEQPGQWPPGYGHPQQAQGHPAGQHALQPGYAPQHGYAQPDPYAQPPGHAAPHGYAPEQAPSAHGVAGHSQPYYANPGAGSDHFGQPATAPPAGYDRYGAPARRADTQGYVPPPAFGQGYAGAAAPAYAPPAAEQQSWDLANYAPGQGAQNYGQGQPGYAAPAGQQGHYPSLDPHAYGRGDGQPQYDPRIGAQGWPPAQPGQHPEHGGSGGYDQGQYAPGAHSGAHPGQPYHDPQQPDPQSLEQEFAFDEPEEEAPRRGPRALVVVGALVGAIVAGGGLAYGYKMFGGSKDTGKPPVVRADKSPAKSKPADAGGKDVAHTDKKFLNRLADDKPLAATAVTPVAPAAPVAAVAPNDPEAPRKVTTLIVNKDGSLTPQAGPIEPSPSRGVPGMVVEGLNTPRPQLRGAAPVETQQPLQAPVARAAQPAAPRVAELPLPRLKEPVAAEAKPAVVKKKPQVRDDLAAPVGAAAVPAKTAALATAASGFVAVLTSKKSRESALASFADLNEKYPDILKGRTPDVREKDFGDAPTGPKGVWYRLVVGPPGSREAARDICQKLDAQNFKGCFAMAY